MKKIVKRICFLLALVSYLGLSSAKIATGKFQLSSEETEQYLAKFSFSPNAQGHISGWFHPETGHQYFDNMPHNLQVCLLEETAWDRFQEIIKKGSLCRERMHLCTWSTPVKISRGNRFKFNLNVEVEPRSHFWFAIVTDCYLEEYDAHPPILEYEIIFKNGGSHMPADEDGLTSVHLYLLIALGLFGAVYCYLMVLQYKHTGQLHLVVMFLLAAYAAQFGSVLFEYLHLTQFAEDGKGYRWRHTWFALDFFSEILQGLSELIIKFMLIALAFGWTLLPGVSSLDPSKHSSGSACLQAFVRTLRSPSNFGSFLLFIVMASIQVSLELLGRGYEDDFNQFHDHEHWPGYCIMMLRVVYCLLFIVGISSTLKKANPHVLPFLSQLRMYGAVWFLTFPALVFSATFFPPTSRHAIITGGALCLQALALALLARLFTQRDGNYFKVSSLANMGTIFSSASVGGATKFAFD